MILCVDIQSIKSSDKVIKDIDLDGLLRNHTKYFDTEIQALESKYVPLDFSTSVRSSYSNLVLEIDKGEGKRYYTNLTNIQPFVHKGYDLIMYLSSIALMHSIDYKIGFDELMMKHSQFVPIGLYNPDFTIMNPIVYSQVVMSDEGVKELISFLKEGRRLVSIHDIKKLGNIKALLDTLLIEVKEKKNESSDNN